MIRSDRYDPAAQKIIDRLEAELIAERGHVVAQKAMVLSIIGGTVEGNPTGPHNYLQRLRELVAIEKQRDAMVGTMCNLIDFAGCDCRRTENLCEVCIAIENAARRLIWAKEQHGD